MLTKATPEIKERFEELKRIRLNDPDVYIEKANDFYNIVQEDGNQDLKDLASVLLGDACIINNDYSYAISLLTEGINGVVNSTELEIAVRGLNEIGVVMHTQGHYISAQESFMKCIRMSRENDFPMTEAMACYNFASLCMEMDDCEDALVYYRRALECFFKLEQSPVRSGYAVSVLCQMVHIYIKMNNELKVTTSYREMEIYAEEAGENKEEFAVMLCRLCYRHYIKDEYSEKLEKDAFQKRFIETQDYTRLYEECMRYFNYLYEVGDYELLEQDMNHYRSISVCEDMANQFVHTQALYMKLYEKIKDTEKLNQSAQMYIKLMQQRTEDAKKTFITATRLQTQLYLNKHESIMQTAAEDVDDMTGLPGRKNLFLIADGLFEEARSFKMSFGVEIINIDRMAETNDAMGSEVGDEYIKRFAEVLQQIKSKNCYISRYGGDEFVVIYINSTDETIISNAKLIHEKAKEISQELFAGNITVSQGIINAVPLAHNRNWDFFSVADEVLFTVKHNGGGMARLVHHRNEVMDKFKRLF